MKSQSKKYIIKIIHRILVFNFWHFISVFLFYVYRTYLEVGHLPFWKHPVYFELTDISKSWSFHYHWVTIAFLLAFLGFWFWLLINLVTILIFKFNRKSNSAVIDWRYAGVIGSVICYWLIYVSSFGYFQWFSD